MNPLAAKPARARLCLAIPKLEEELARELHTVEPARTLLVNFPPPGVPLVLPLPAGDASLEPLYWVEADLGACTSHPFRSISDAAAILRKLGQERGGRPAHVSLSNHRRGELIAETFRRKRPDPPLPFPPNLEDRRTGRPALPFALADAETLWIAERPSPEPVDGIYSFQEDRTNPPSRAYLKLWEVFTRLGTVPSATDRAIDLGSAPGGWTWVLSRFCAQTFSIDGAPIVPELLSDSQVTFTRGDAFSLAPDAHGELDWICSDMICTPERLLELVLRWLPVHPRARFVCTLKFKGPASRATIEAFSRIPGGRVVHLHQNKHELTFLRIP